MIGETHYWIQYYQKNSNTTGVKVYNEISSDMTYFKLYKFKDFHELVLECIAHSTLLHQTLSYNVILYTSYLLYYYRFCKISYESLCLFSFQDISKQLNIIWTYEYTYMYCAFNSLCFTWVCSKSCIGQIDLFFSAIYASSHPSRDLNWDWLNLLRRLIKIVGLSSLDIKLCCQS